MTELTQILPFASLLIAAVALFRNLKGDTKQDAGQMMEIIVKLENINEGVKDIKSEVKDIRTDMDKTKERLVVVEQSLKSAHKRIDTLHHQHEETE